MRTAALLFLAAAATLTAQNATRPGRFHVEHPTLHNLGFEWKIEGDANRNATVQVRFRKQGTEQWRSALPLLRIGGERIYRERESMTYTVPDGFAGSILNVEPGTSYECEFTLSDPDGVIAGQAQQRVTVATRTEPMPYKGGRILHVYPPDHEGPRLEPSFIGLKAAYYGEGRGDWTNVRMKKAQPGDTILVHAGLYRPDRLNYVDPLSAPLTGISWLTLKGTAEKPITIKGAGDGEAIFDGGGNSKLFDVMATRHHIFEDLTFRNTEVALFAGEKDVMGAVGLTVRNCRFEDVGVGIWTESADSQDFYIADNLFLGREDRRRVIGWNQAGQRTTGIYPSHQLRSFFAVKVYGPGHVITHNAVAYFHDGICISTYGPPEPELERQASSIDISYNDIHLSNDDFIESDGGAHNIRVYGNRGVNAFHNGLSAQPMFGGPVYFFRNVLYNVVSGGAFKFNAKPAGILVYQNTLIAEQAATDPYSNAHFRNNLFLGRDAKRGVMVWAKASAHHSSDYNGYRPNRGVTAQYRWLSPAQDSPLYEPKETDWKSATSLADVQKATGQEAHSLEIDYDVFEDLRPPNASDRYKVYHSADLNFRLSAAGKAVDAGLALPTINDGFSGRAPDLGALEQGQPEPHYGPRWITKQPFYR
jgi:hypothetical protein